MNQAADTPITDAAFADGIHLQDDWLAHSRKLELDRAALIAALVSIGTMPTVGPLAAADMANIANRTLAQVCG